MEGITMLKEGVHPRSIEVAGLQAGHVSHLRLREQVLIVVGLVDEDAVDMQLRRRRRIGTGDRQVAQRERQRMRHEAHFAHPQFAPQRLRAAAFQLPFEQRRDAEPGQHPEHPQRSGGPQQQPQQT